MTAMLSVDELRSLMQEGETSRAERKRTAEDLDDIRHDVCAFANDLPGHRLPGVIFVGVERDGRCSGIPVNDRLLDRLAQIRLDGAIQPVPAMQVERVTIDGCDLVVIQVEPSDNPPVRWRNRVCVRVGASRSSATPEEERRLVERRRAGNLPF